LTRLEIGAVDLEERNTQGKNEAGEGGPAAACAGGPLDERRQGRDGRSRAHRDELRRRDRPGEGAHLRPAQNRGHRVEQEGEEQDQAAHDHHVHAQHPGRLAARLEGQDINQGEHGGGREPEDPPGNDQHGLREALKQARERDAFLVGQPGGGRREQDGKEQEREDVAASGGFEDVSRNEAADPLRQRPAPPSWRSPRAASTRSDAMPAASVGYCAMIAGARRANGAAAGA
jgi:hypothetical protein